MRLELTQDLAKVRDTFIDIIENTPDMDKHARWVYGLHPTDETIQRYIDKDEMYLLTDGDSIVGVVAIALSQGDDYREVEWNTELCDDEVVVLHILGVCPSYQGKGVAKILLSECVSLAKTLGRKAVRLDTLLTNLPAQHMYSSFGFTYCGQATQYAVNTGYTEFLYYEYIL